METEGEYRVRAGVAEARAEQAADPAIAATYRLVAHTWLLLAENAARKCTAYFERMGTPTRH